MCNGKQLEIILVHQNSALPVEAILCKDNRGRQDTRQKVLFCHYTDQTAKYLGLILIWFPCSFHYFFDSLLKHGEHLQWHTELYISEFWLKFNNQDIFIFHECTIFITVFKFHKPELAAFKKTHFCLIASETICLCILGWEFKTGYLFPFKPFLHILLHNPFSFQSLSFSLFLSFCFSFFSLKIKKKKRALSA